MFAVVMLIFIIISYHTSHCLTKIFLLGRKKNGNLSVIYKKVRDESSKKVHLLYKVIF